MSTSSSAEARAALLARTNEFVAEYMKQYKDASHDYEHVDRVRRTALSLAAEEGVDDADVLFVVELAALLHDVGDSKFSGSELAGAAAVGKFLDEAGCEPEVARRVVYVVDNVSFSKELGGAKVEITPELGYVQDADRLDAIGAVGVGRTFTYSGKRNRVMYNPEVTNPQSDISKEDYVARREVGAVDVGTLQHFHDKLLTLAARMKTKAGARRAKARHEFMERFVEQFVAEHECRA